MQWQEVRELFPNQFVLLSIPGGRGKEDYYGNGSRTGYT